MLLPSERPVPTTEKELFARLSAVVQHGPYEMSDERRYAGTGGAGRYLEDLLGLTAGNKDIPDGVGWESKFYTAKTSLITLLHKDPRPKGILREMVSRYGRKDARGRLSFRHTISGKSDRFKVGKMGAEEKKIIVRCLKGHGPAPYWTFDDILSAAGAKLRRVVLVKGTRKGQAVSYERVDCLENLVLSQFIDEIVKGTVRIDFDVRESIPASKAPRNHGTKFRVSPDDIGQLYEKKNRLC